MGFLVNFFTSTFCESFEHRCFSGLPIILLLLSKTLCLQELRQVFGNFGWVKACYHQKSADNQNVAEALVQMDSIASASRAILAIDACGPSDPLAAALGPFMHAHFYADRQPTKNCLPTEQQLNGFGERCEEPYIIRALNEYQHHQFVLSQKDAMQIKRLEARNSLESRKSPALLL